MFNDGKLPFYSHKNVVYIYIYRCLMMENYHSIAKKCGLYIYRCLMMENYHSIAIKMWFKYIDV